MSHKILLLLCVVAILALAAPFLSQFRHSYRPSVRRSSAVGLPAFDVPPPNNCLLGGGNIVPAPAPLVEKRWDNPLDKIAIFFMSNILAFNAPDRKAAMKFVSPGMGYDGFVSISKVLMRDSSPSETRSNIVNILKTCVPFFIRAPFQLMFKTFPKFLCEKCSLWMNFNMLAWLVGPAERFHIEIPLEGTGETEQWRSGVRLTECRYLKESGCKANCLHLCKGPTQEFFMNDLNLPLYMKPNFTDYSCELQFGVVPPSEEDDPAYKEKCFKDCPAAKFSGELKC